MSATGSAGSPPRLAVLGADGFIGSHVMRVAGELGCSATGFCVRDPWRLADSTDADLVPVPGGAWWEPDFADRLGRELEGVDALLLLAYAPPADRTPDAWRAHEREINVAGACRVIDVAMEHCGRIVFTSSADVYGPGTPGRVREDAETRPATPYSEAKLMVEEHLATLTGDCLGCSLRLATVYGPGENGPRAVPSFIRAHLRGERPVIHGTGADVRDYVCVDDVAAAVLSAALAPASTIREGGGLFNVGSGTGRRTTDVLATVAAAMGARSEAEHVASDRPPSHLVLDPARAIEHLGTSFERDFRLEVEREVEWLRGHLAGAEPVAGSALES